MNVKKEPDTVPVVTVDSDSDNEFIQVYKDDVATEVSLENNRIMISDLIALFPTFHGIQLIGNGINRMLSKTKFAKKGYFSPPKAGWAAVKIHVLVVESTAMESINSSARSTPENVKAVKKDELPIHDLPVPSPAPTPVRVSDEDILDRFKVENMAQLLNLPQFYSNPDPHFLEYRDKFVEVFRGPMMALGPESFNLPFLHSLSTCRTDVSRLIPSLEGEKAIICNVCDVAFSKPEDAFQHYSSISHGEKYLSVKNTDALELVNILKYAKEHTLFPPPVHPNLAAPIRPSMANMLPPPRLINAPPLLLAQRRQTRFDIPPAPVRLPLPPFQEPPRPQNWMPINYRPAVGPQSYRGTLPPQSYQAPRFLNAAYPPSYPIRATGANQQSTEASQPYQVRGTVPPQNFSVFQKSNGPSAAAPLPSTLLPVDNRQRNVSESNNNGTVAAKPQNTDVPTRSSDAVSNIKHGKRKHLSSSDESSDDEETPGQIRKALTQSQRTSSRSKKSRHNESDEERQAPAASSPQPCSSHTKIAVSKPSSSCRTKKPSSSPPKKPVRANNYIHQLQQLAESDPQPSSLSPLLKRKKKPQPVEPETDNESDSSDFEVMAHVNRPIKGEFGEETISRTPQIPEKELLFHFKVRSITELKKLRPMKVPIMIHDLDDFHKFQNFAFEHLRNTLVKAPQNKLMYTLFMASKSEVSYKTLDGNAKKKCSMCKEELTLKHILSKKHVLLYREKYYSDPEEIMVILEPKNQNFYIGDDERPRLLQDYKVRTYDALKTLSQFYRNPYYDAGSYIPLRDALIERLKKSPNLRLDPRFFRVEYMLYLKSGNDKHLKSAFQDDYEHECEACGVEIESWMHYMKHIVSKHHIRKQLTQRQANAMIRAMRMIHETPDGFQVVQSKKKLRQRTDSESGESSSPPDDPLVSDNEDTVSLEELKSRLKALEKYKKPSSKQKEEIEILKGQIASLK